MKQKQGYLSKKSNSIELLILGNSHASCGIDPTQFELHAYNGANGLQPLYYDIEITRKYLPSMTSLKYVLISMDYHSLYFTFPEARDFMYSYYYGVSYKKESSIKTNFSLLYFGYGVQNGIYMLNKKPYTSINGWVGLQGTKNLNDLAGKKRVALFDRMIEKNTDRKKENIERLESFILLLKQRNITPILITMPCHYFYNSNLNSEIVIQNRVYIKSVCKKYSISHLDYLYYKLPDSCYLNVDHLNKKGAKVMSRKINDHILSLEGSNN